MPRRVPHPEPRTNGQPAAATRERILDAAAAVFAEQGFRAATVRDICARAGANIAAINYHFGDKAGLYAQVVEHQCVGAQTRNPIVMDPASPAEQRLAAFIRAFLSRILDEDAPAQHTRLMSREMVEPTPALDRVVSTTIRPTFEVLSSIVRELLGPAATPRLVRDRSEGRRVGKACGAGRTGPQL